MSLAAWLLVGRHGNAESLAAQSELQMAIASSLESPDQAELRPLYQGRDHQAIWLDGQGPTADAKAVMRLLEQADTQGLPAARYKLDQAPEGETPRSRAAFELALSHAAMAYARDMKFGLLNPEKQFSDTLLPKRPDDIAERLQAAAQEGHAAAYLSSLEPKTEDYGFLKAALARYRDLTQNPWPALQPDETAPLAERLAKEGFLPSAAASSSQVTDALKIYQATHGIDPTGRLDKETVASLNISPAQRAEQIAVNMERWRWLPAELESERIMVNVPSATLVYMRDGAPVLASRVVVGAPDKRTPILATSAIAVTLNPVWHLPKSIVEKEIKPKLDADPGYLQAKNMEVVEDGGIVQRPGPANALGTAKFEMPNEFDVYMHDTPSRQAFLSDERALSHGCVRVERIHTLVEAVLGLSQEEIARRIATGETSRLPLERPIPVYIIYATAIRSPEGTIMFLDDIYRRDARMIAALGAKQGAERQ